MFWLGKMSILKSHELPSMLKASPLDESGHTLCKENKKASSKKSPKKLTCKIEVVNVFYHLYPKHTKETQFSEN